MWQSSALVAFPLDLVPALPNEEVEIGAQMGLENVAAMQGHITPGGIELFGPAQCSATREFVFAFAAAAR